MVEAGVVNRRRKICVAVCGLLLMAAAGVGVYAVHWHIGRHRRQVEWWLDHYYPRYGGLMPPEQRYFGSYEAWSQAGQAIPNADAILTEMYGEAGCERDKELMLYAMGAIPTPTTVEFLASVASSSESRHLRESALNYGLLINIEMPMVQLALLEYLREDQRSPYLRCLTMVELVDSGNADAAGYAQQNWRQVLLEAEADAKHDWAMEHLRSRVFAATRPAPQ